MTFHEIFWYFVIYSALGWGLEVCYCSVDTGKFVNRGFLNGPVCPIYGFGMLLVCGVLGPVSGSLPLLFAGGMALASALELVGGWALKKIFHTTWWDYSDEPFNLGGYICLKFSLAWGVCVVLAMRVIHPIVANLVGYMPHTVSIVLGCVCTLAFAVDAAATVADILRLDETLVHISAVAGKMREGSDTIAEALGDTAIAVDGKLDSYGPEFSARMDLLRAELADRRHMASMRLLRAFPDMKNLRHGEALDTLRAWYQSKTEK